MKEKLIFLGIETSCDETAASVVREKADGTGEILSNVVSSQIEEHKEYGGVVPEIAARAHVEKIEFIIKKALKESNLNFNKISGISATAGPGLIVCLTVGLNAGKAIAGSLKKPFIAVNHLEGHALSPKINNKIKFPYLLLLISGGHTQFLEVKGVNNYKRLGTTIDDALGSDLNTIKGFGYYAQGETPGLGGEVDNPNWKSQWVGKKIYDESENVEFKVAKGQASGNYQVDGLSGATITGNGVSSSIKYWFGEHGYKTLLENLKSGGM